MSILKEDLDAIIFNTIGLEKLKECNVLITGGTGLIMTYFTYLVMELNSRDWNINLYVVCRSEEKAKKKYKLYENDDRFHLIVADVCDCLELPETIHYVIHAASLAVPELFKHKPVETLSANVWGTYNLINMLSDKSIKKFMYVSSCDVYSSGFEGDKIPESFVGFTDFNDIKYVYNQAKRMGELICRSFYDEYNFPACVARPVYIYSPENNEKKHTAFADFMNCAVNNTDIRLNSLGKAIRSYCYITDCISALITILVSEDSGFQVYNISNSTEEITIRQLADYFAEACDNRVHVEINIDDKNTNSINDRIVVDTTKLERLGWKPLIGIKEGIIRTLRGWRESNYD